MVKYTTAVYRYSNLKEGMEKLGAEANRAAVKGFQLHSYVITSTAVTAVFVQETVVDTPQLTASLVGEGDSWG